jgi:hypothetical protein
MTREVASSWAKVFEPNLFSPISAKAYDGLQSLINNISDSAPIGMQDHCKKQAELSLNEAKLSIEKIMYEVLEQMMSEQKDISRCLGPHVVRKLSGGYLEAALQRGKGCSVRQKVCDPLSPLNSTTHSSDPCAQSMFHSFLVETRDTLFSDAADILLSKLDAAANGVGEALRGKLDELADKV